ncbi:MAG: GDSL-type esterase/lipase family protein [Candidatus Cohnella colombiensis]|uniref:GDSL-type esterase/lipase family protein n=1 Tax=Candidatus Cohnella colombiensis TaxID=3121368 RepID=A0AA95JE70_9BACL|nr:MAG: GDSL-type esterase/lipase family protein [Cohnella sp.]
MKSTSRLWKLIGGTALVCLIVLLTGFGWALRDVWYPTEGIVLPATSSQTPTPATGGDLYEKEQLRVTALGDSLTKGTGDARGKGYVTRVVEGLSKAMDKPVSLINNLAINGLTTEQLITKLEDSGFRNALLQADIILLTIGGNDLFQMAQTGGAMGEGGDLSPEIVEEQLPTVTPHLDTIFTKLREMNATARIIYVGLYNPFYDLEQMRPGSQSVAKWNDYAYQLAETDGNATVVPSYDLFEYNIKAYLASDHFHPNEEGYSRIAERVVQALN